MDSSYAAPGPRVSSASRLQSRARIGRTLSAQLNKTVSALLLLLLALLIGACGGGGSSSIVTPPAPPPPTPATDPDARADQLIAQMTQAEELQLVTGSGTPGNYNLDFPRGAGGYVPGISRLGIPDLYFSDGSAGFRRPHFPPRLRARQAGTRTRPTNTARLLGATCGRMV